MVCAGMEENMSKIICDVCGTTYPETAAQCPICGCATPGEVDTVADETVLEEEAVSTYVPTKGGRFSKSNVRKRNKASESAEQTEDVLPPEEPGEEPEEPVEKNSNKGLMVTAIILLLAIIAVVVYIAVRFFLPPAENKNDPETTGAAATTVATQAVQTEAPVPTTETQPAVIPCTGLNLADNSVILDEAGKMWLLNVTALPENTTDVITFTSSNEAVATVDFQGCVTAVAPGEAIITITCGEQKGSVLVDCVFIGEAPEETTAPTEETEPEDETQSVADPDAEYTVLFYGEWREDNDITLATGESVYVTLEDEEGNEAKVTWKADEEGIVEIDGNTFTGSYPGIAYVTAEYGGTTYTIIVRVW